MKKINFVKMAAAGNDFVIIDGKGTARSPRAKPGRALTNLAVAVCHRKTGIGADGLLVLDIVRARHAVPLRYKMRIINADGSEAEMCGNGVRCLAHYIVHEKTHGGGSLRRSLKLGRSPDSVKRLSGRAVP